MWFFRFNYEVQRKNRSCNTRFCVCTSLHVFCACLRAVSGPVAGTDSDLQKDEEEEEGEDSLLCDPEEMDLLGEIFDTLSSRSLHERGLLYGARSLDLFGPDSHDFITEVRGEEQICVSVHWYVHTHTHIVLHLE